MRRALASLSSAVVLLGLLVGVAPGAHAADLGVVNVGNAAGVTTLSRSTLQGVVGDTFDLTDVTQAGVNGFFVRGNTGSVERAGVPCTVLNPCVVGAGATVTLTITALGTLDVKANGMDTTTLSLQPVSSTTGSAPTDPALVYPTLYLNPNGGTCTGTMQFTKYNGQNGTVTLPFNRDPLVDSYPTTIQTCTRPGFSLWSWSRSPSTMFPAREWFGGQTVPIGDESFTLYAVWVAIGVALTYDANVGMNVACLKDGVNLAESSERSVTRGVGPTTGALEALSWDPASSEVRWTGTQVAPVCSPPGYAFLGWSTTPSGPAVGPSAANTRIESFPGFPNGIVDRGGSLTLYAQWGLTWGVQMTATSQQLAPGGTATLTVTALRNGSADAGAPRQLRIVDSAGAVSLFSPFTSPAARTSQFQTNSDGTLSIPIYASQTPGTGTITATYGNATQTLEFTVGSPQPGSTTTEPASITITGERTTVSGKPGIRVDGNVAGLPEGTKVIPWFRFPGQTEYSQSSARPTTNADGEFVWQRKTGKKLYTYVTTEDGSVQSNRVIIPAK